MSSLFDRVFALVQARASSLGDGAGGILLNLLGFASGANDADAETSAGEPVYGTPGVYCRPLDADDAGCAEYIAARGVDDLCPLAGRDLRITAARTTSGQVAKGTVGIAGYGGAYVEIVQDPTTKKDVVTVKNGGLSVVLDPTAESITVTAGSGSASLGPSGVTVTWAPPAPAGQAQVSLGGTGVTLTYDSPLGGTASVALAPNFGGAQVQIVAPGGMTVNGVPLIVP